MNLQTYAKVGIIVGIAAVVIFSVLFSLMMVNQLQYEFVSLFVDKDQKINEMKNDRNKLREFLISSLVNSGSSAG